MTDINLEINRQDINITANLMRATLSSPWVDVRDYPSFSAAIDAIGALEKTLLIPNEQAVTANKTVPSNVTLLFLQGGSLNISADKTVTINGNVEAGLYQIFEGSGSVEFGAGSVKEVHPEWWGAKGGGITDDTIAIQAAFDSLSSGGRVFFSIGTWNISTAVKINYNNIYIMGTGWGSVIHQLTENWNGIEVTTGYGSTIIENLKFTGTGNWILGGRASIMLNPIDTGLSSEIIINKCYLNSPSVCGVATNRGKKLTITNCITKDIGEYGIYASKIEEVIITNNHLDGSTAGAAQSSGIKLNHGTTGGRCIISANIIQNHTSSGIFIGDSDYEELLIQGNIIKGNGAVGIGTTQSSTGSFNIADNIITNNGHDGIYLENIESFLITANNIIGNVQGGIEIVTCNNGIVAKNFIKSNEEHGISIITNSNNNSILGNTCIANSQKTDNTYDAIFINSDSNYNNVQNNLCRHGGGVKQPKVGISINNANCDGNLVINNDLYTSGKTANFSDAGTGTITDAGNRPVILYGSSVWNPANLVDGAGETSGNITVTGAVVGDMVQVYPPYSLQAILCTGYVSAADTANIRIQNETGGAIDLASGTWKIKVFKY